jgi:hypothetical protein
MRMALTPTTSSRRKPFSFIFFCNAIHAITCIPNIARAQLHFSTTPIPKDMRQYYVLGIRDITRIKCDTSAEKREVVSQHWIKQRRASTISFSWARERKAGITKALIAFMNSNTDSDHRKSGQKRPFGQNTDCDLSSSRNPRLHPIHFHPRTTF